MYVLCMYVCVSAAATDVAGVRVSRPPGPLRASPALPAALAQQEKAPMSSLANLASSCLTATCSA